MFKKISVIVILSIFMTGCFTNPYVQKLKIYEMQISQGRDKAFSESLERTRIERIDVEKQFNQLGFEMEILITAYEIYTDKTKEEIMAENILQVGEIFLIMEESRLALNNRIDEINASYDTFFKEIDIQDEKIKVVQYGIKEAKSVRDDAYKKIGYTLITGAATTAILAPK